MGLEQSEQSKIYELIKTHNWLALVHALETEEQLSKFNTFGAVDNEALLSTSYIDINNYKVFRKHGMLLDVAYDDIHAGYYRDFGTGYSKEIELLKQDYLFKGFRTETDMGLKAWRGNRVQYRDYISSEVKKALGLTDDEYIKRIDKILDCKSITDIEKKDKELADKLLDLFKNMQAGKRAGGRQYNEMLVSRPKIQGVFCYDEKYEEIPKFLRKYAQDNNLPIIIFG